MNRRNAAAEEWIALSRASALQPLIDPANTVLEYGARNCSNLSRLNVRRKLLCLREGAVGLQDDRIEFVEGLDAVAAGSVDLILCHHILEYLAEPAEAINQLKQLLKPGGKLLVLAVYDRAFQHPRLARKASHFYSWNVQTLGNLTIDCGFEFESGSVCRRSNEDSVCRWANKFPSKPWVCGVAARLSRIFSPEFEVVVTGKRSG